MTKLTKPVSRTISISGRDYIVTLIPGHEDGTRAGSFGPVIEFRQKHKRTALSVTLGAVLTRAAMAAADGEREQRRARRREASILRGVR